MEDKCRWKDVWTKSQYRLNLSPGKKGSSEGSFIGRAQKGAFTSYDRNSDGYIDARELAKGMHITEEEAREMIDAADTDVKDGKISGNEFNEKMEAVRTGTESYGTQWGTLNGRQWYVSTTPPSPPLEHHCVVADCVIGWFGLVVLLGC